MPILIDLPRWWRIVPAQLPSHFGGGQIRSFLERVVFRLEDVEVELVAFGQFFVGEGFESLTLFSIATVLRVIAFDKVVQVGALERVFLEGKNAG
jgi:hypothetical protein